MASNKRSRSRGGHPAKVAERRERERARREGPRDAALQLARRVAGEAASLETAFEAELWASHLLGAFWLPTPLSNAAPTAADELVAPIVGQLARMGGESALAALRAIAEVADTEIGPMARTAGARLLSAGVAAPDWSEAVGAAEILGTAVLRETIFDDGVTVFVEARHPDGEHHAVGVYIDHNLGGMAKDILIADSLASVRETLTGSREPEHDSLVLEPISPQEAGGRIFEAMDVTDMTIQPPVGEDYASLRALALMRAAELTGPPEHRGEDELAPEEREALLEAFLASPEADGFGAGSDEAFVASLAIDYGADHQIGGPLRWSAITVELFMTDWLPRKVVAERSVFDAVPQALEAWVRYAARRRDLPAWAVEVVVGAIEEWTDEMFAAIDGGEARSPASDFIHAAQAAGVDLTDEQALATFVAGWNARSERP